MRYAGDVTRDDVDDAGDFAEIGHNKCREGRSETAEEVGMTLMHRHCAVQRILTWRDLEHDVTG